jgi:peptide-methionine (S)-S-oxide reductase
MSAEVPRQVSPHAAQNRVFSRPSLGVAWRKGDLNMFRSSVRSLAGLFVLLPLAALLACHAASATVNIPSPAVDDPLVAAPAQQTAVLAGGCFWGIQAVFEHVKGVISATSGSSGGAANTAQYDMVSTGRTGHAESVQIIYDPSRVSYGQLLQVYFSVAHDPTQLNRQGPDEGTQYRSAIFYANDEQKRIAEAYIDQLKQAKVFRRSIVTKVVTLYAFYPAEAYHQRYADKHPDNPYIATYDLPKVSDLLKGFPDLYVGKN